MWGRFNIEASSEMYSGQRDKIAILVRMVRRIRDAQRRRAGLRRRREGGVAGFTAYDSASGTRQMIEWALRDE
jgi:hypothetical protein